MAPPQISFLSPETLLLLLSPAAEDQGESNRLSEAGPPAGVGGGLGGAEEARDDAGQGKVEVGGRTASEAAGDGRGSWADLPGARKACKLLSFIDWG